MHPHDVARPSILKPQIEIVHNEPVNLVQEGRTLGWTRRVVFRKANVGGAAVAPREQATLGKLQDERDTRGDGCPS